MSPPATDDGSSRAPAHSATPGAVDPLPADGDGLHFVRELGRGGMGVVYEAEEAANGRRVAIKVVSSRAAMSLEVLQRFDAEARLAASISHPNCVFVYGARRVSGAPAIAMELMSGRTLEDTVRGGTAIPIATAVRYVIELLDGLEAAHRAGVIHRDVKPSNCFLTADDHVKVGDFGLSRSTDVDLRLTQSGAFVGSPFYASPEQIRGRELDRRTDIYSAGATLYTLFTGRPAFGGSNFGDVLARIAAEPPPSLRAARPDVPPALEKVVLRALAKDPANRYRDAAAFRAALLPFGPGGLTNAALGLRVAAYFIDMGLLSVVVIAMRWVLHATGFPQFGMADGSTFAVLDTTASRWITAFAGLTYFTVSDGAFGATLGKRLLGLRVADAGSPRLTVWRTVVRNAVFFATVATGTMVYGTGDSGQIANALRGGSWLLMLTPMRRRNGWRGLHELASGTRVVQIRGDAERDHAAALDPARPRTRGLPERLGRYAVEGFVGGAGDGDVLVGRDAELARDVWIWRRGPMASPAAAAGSGAEDPTRLRLLERGGAGGSFDVYESPGGVSLAEYAASKRRTAWPQALGWLQALAASMDETAPAPPARLWIDRGGRLRILDFDVGPTAERSERPTAPAVLADAGRVFLRGGDDRRQGLGDDVPADTEAVLGRLLGDSQPFATLAEARAALASLPSQSGIVTRGRRAMQLAASGVVPIFGVGVGMLGASLATAQMPSRSAGEIAGMIAAATVGVGWAVPSVVVSFVLRGGLMSWMLGIRVRDGRGRRASRLRCALRTLLARIPVACFAVGALVSIEVGDGAAARLGAAVTVALFLAGVTWSIAVPSRGPHDRVLGTRLVRR